MKTVRVGLLAMVVLFGLLGPALGGSTAPFGGGVCIMFDDSKLVTHTNAVPYLNQLGLKGTFYVISARVGTNSATINWTQARELVTAGHEVGDHTLNHKDLTTLTDAVQTNELAGSKKLLETQLGVTVRSLAFPFGAYDQRTLQNTARYYENSGIVNWSGVVDYNSFPLSSFQFLREKVHSNSTPAQVIGWINDARSKSELLCLLFHNIVTTTPLTDEDYRLSDFKQIMDYIAAQQIPTPTISQALVMPVGTNCVANAGFDNVNAAGWALNWGRQGNTNNVTAVQVTPDTQRLLSPYPGRQLKIVGSATENMAYSDMLLLPDLNRAWADRLYMFRLYTELSLTAGGFGIWVDEFDQSGNYVTGQGLGYFSVSTVDRVSFLYRPTNDQIKYIGICVYSDLNTTGTGVFDSLFFGSILNSTSAPDTTAPTLAITSPLNGAVVTNASLTLVGTASDASGVASVTVNGTAAASTNSYANWTAPFTLAVGTNLFTVVATDKAAPANATTNQLTVVYTIPSSGGGSGPFGGGVVLAFDDGRTLSHINAVPYMNQLGIKGTFYLVGGSIGVDSDTISWAQARELVAAGHEVGDHTLHHLHLSTLSDAQLTTEMANSKSLLESQLGVKIRTMAFPYGDYNQTVIKKAAKYYETTGIVAWEGYPPYNTFPASHYVMLRREVKSWTTPAEAIGWINEARSSNKLLIMLFHDIVTGTPPDEWCYTQSNFIQILNYIAANRIPTPTVSQALTIPVGTNCLANAGFDTVDALGWATKWTKSGTATKITAVKTTTTTQRLYSPYPGYQLKIVGSSTANIASSEKTQLPGLELPLASRKYLVQLYAEITLSSKTFGVSVSEYDANKVYLSAKTLGTFNTSVTDLSGLVYTPTSANVKYVTINIYSAAGASGTGVFDSTYLGLLPN